MSRRSVSLQLLQSAVDAVEQTMHHALGGEPDFQYTSQTDLLSPAEEERVRKEETASNRERPELAAGLGCHDCGRDLQGLFGFR